MVGRSAVRRAILAVVCGAAACLPATRPAPVVAGPTIATVPKAICQPSDHVEPALQGQVPVSARLSGDANTPYNCNLKQIGAFDNRGWISFDTYKNCAYFPDSSGRGDTGTVVLDVSDPSHPKKTAYLTSPAMMNPHESMKVNDARGLLVGDHPSSFPLDVWSVGGDCTKPVRQATVPMSVQGHEGFFAPDGRTYYVSPYSATVTAIDLTDPTHPKELGTCTEVWCQIHGGSVSEDGMTGYFAQTASPDGLAIVDLSDFQLRKPNPKMRLIGSLEYPWNAANQATDPLNYNGHRYLLSYGELTSGGPSCGTTYVASGGTVPCPVSPLGTPHCPTQVANGTNFDYPRILDIADPKNPQIVARLQNEVDDPANCPLVAADNSDEPQELLTLAALFTYDAHMCSPDRLHNPTVVACAQIGSGVRVYDVRDPKNPKELAYYSLGVWPQSPQGTPYIDTVGARPVIRTDLHQIWFVATLSGFHVLQFENNAWPFADTARCPLGFDYYQRHYDLGYDACLAAATSGSSAGSTSASVGGTPNTTASRAPTWAAAAIAVPVAVLAIVGGRRRRRQRGS